LSALCSAWVPSEHNAHFDRPRNPYWGYRNWEVGVDNKLQYWHVPYEQLQVGNMAVVLPRLLNVILGALTIGITYALGVRIWPDRKGLALAPAALVAFNPQFIYLSAAINNDIMAALTGTAVLYVCLVVLQDGLHKGIPVWMGVIFALAVLSKIHMLALAPVIAVTLGVAAWRQRDTNNTKSCLILLSRALMTVFGITAVLTGWWFARNVLLYGDVTGMSRLNEMWGGRSAVDNLWALQQGLPYLWSSLWGRFGFGQIPLPEPFYAMMSFFCIVGIVGCLRSDAKIIPPTVLRIFGLAILLFLGIVSYYMLIQPAGAMGRFLFPVFPIFAVLVIAGWAGFMPSVRWLVFIVVVAMACFATIALGLYWYPAVGYPSSIQGDNAQPILQFDDLAQVSEISLYPQAINPGEPVFLTVTWHPLTTTMTPITVYVHLVDQAGAVIAQRDTWPGLGRAPTTSWRVGRPFVDTYRIDVPESVYNPNIVTVQFGLYNTEGRFAVYQVDSSKLLPEGAGGIVEIIALEGRWPNPLDVNFDNQIQLAGYTIEPRHLNAGETLTLTLYWNTLRDLDADYAVFAQVLDQNWQVWGSKDGGNPGWITGIVVKETRMITLIPETPSGTYPIQVGVFDRFGRLPIITPDGRHLDDRVLLGPIRVD